LLPHFVSQNEQFQELKAKAEAEILVKQKTKRVVQMVEALLKQACNRKFGQGAESAEQLFADTWHTEEKELIEAQAYFNKHSPVAVNCLRKLSAA
jgi:hypothetical protein